MMILLPYIVYDDFKHGYKKDAIMLLITGIIILTLIVGFIVGLYISFY